MRDDTKNDCEGDKLFSRLTEAYRDSIKEASKTLILFQMEEDISPTSLNAGGVGSEVWNRVYMIAPVKKFGRVRLSTNFP